MKYAVIDIGSNSVRLMLWADGTLYKKVCTTRLAEGLSASGSLCQSAMERTARAVADFYREGQKENAHVLAFATAAVRSASNGNDFCALVWQICGLNVDVISGDEEALLGLSGALGHSDGGMIDIGGASTEICIRQDGAIRFSISLPVGAVRILEQCGQDPQKIRVFVKDSLRPLHGDYGLVRMCAIGGTASTLASVRLGLPEYDAEKLNGLSLSRNWLSEISGLLLSLTVEERKKISGMDLRRADVIAGAAVLLSEAVRKLGLAEVYFSDADNLEGYLAVRGLI